MRGKLCQKTFENLMSRGILWIPNGSVPLLEQEDILLPEEELLPLEDLLLLLE